MSLRYTAIGAFVLSFSTLAQAQSPPWTSVIQVQDRVTKPDAWRSLKNLQQFPFVGPEDCSSNDRDYGRADCNGQRKGASRDDANAPPQADRAPAANTPAPDATPTFAAPLGAPLPQQRAAALHESARSAWAVQTGSDVRQTDVQESGIRDLVRRLILLTFDGRSADDPGVEAAQKALKSGAVAGVLIRAGNVETAAQLRQLTAGFTEPGDSRTVVMIDSSNAILRRLAGVAGLESAASPRDLGRAGDALAAFELYREFAAGLSSLGITMDLGARAAICAPHAPAQPDNCFDTAPLTAAAFGTASNLAHQDGHVLTAMRSTLSDSPADMEMLREMVKRKAPDSLVVGVPRSSPLGEDAASAFVTSARAAWFAGTIIFDLSDVPAGKADIGNALAAGADMVILQDGDAQQAEAAAMESVISAINAGTLVRSRLEVAAARASSISAKLLAWSPGTMPPRGEMTSSLPAAVR